MDQSKNKNDTEKQVMMTVITLAFCYLGIAIAMAINFVSYDPKPMPAFDQTKSCIFIRTAPGICTDRVK